MFIAPSYSFTRPADTTPYTAADLVANSTTAGSVVPMRFPMDIAYGRGLIRRVRVFSDNQVVTLASFNVHIFSAQPTVTNGDNAAFAVANSIAFIGTVACDLATGAFVTTTDKHKGFVITGGYQFDLQIGGAGGQALYGLIEASAGYTPASGEIFTVALEIET